MASAEKVSRSGENTRGCSIDKKLVGYKIHYLLLNGAHVGVIPYLPVYAKTTLGCSATAIGVLATTMQFSTMISKPLFGLLADCLNQMKILIASILVLEVLLSLLMLALPSITVIDMHDHQVLPTDSNILLSISPAKVYDASVGLHSQPKIELSLNSPGRPHSSQSEDFKVNDYGNKSTINSTQAFIEKEILSSRASSLWPTSIKTISANQYQNHRCSLKCDSLIVDAVCFQNSTLCMGDKKKSLLTCTLRQRQKVSFCESFQMSSDFTITYNIKDHSENQENLKKLDLILHSFVYHKKLNGKSFVCDTTSVSCNLHCEKPIKLCRRKRDMINIYETYQFWSFCLFALLGAMCQGALYTLSDTVCYERLRGTSADFGRQRLWGAVGWGAIAPLTGCLNDLVTGLSIHEDYSSGWYVMTTLSFCFLINLCCMDFPKSKKSPSMYKDVKNMLKSKQFLLMEIDVFLVGVLTAYSTNYVIWYMETLGSNSVQMGLALAVACLLGNVPFMYFSGWLISKLGHWNIVTLTFGAFAIRFGVYHIVTDPWMILPVELMDGITFGLFYTAMTSYGELLSTPGTEATIQGILGGTYQGLGSGVGCLVAGISFDRFGGKLSFLLVSILSACLALCHSALCLLCKPRKFHLEDVTISDPKC